MSSGQANALNIAPTSSTVVAGTGTAFTPLAYSASSGTSNIVSRDSSGNTYANSLIAGYATTATAAATTTLTVASKQQQFFTGSTTETVLMPVVSTLVLGQTFEIVNNSSGVVTVQSSGANTIQAMAASSNLVLTVIAITGTTASSWSIDYTGAGATGISSLAGTSGSATGSTVTIQPGGASSNFAYVGSGSTMSVYPYDGNANICIGGAMPSVSTAEYNIGIGFNALNDMATFGQSNIAVGYTALGNLVSGGTNIVLNGGTNYTTTESSNILFNNNGVLGESNVLRIGSATGSSATQLNKAFISGINGVTSSNPVIVTINSSTDQLGVSSAASIGASWVLVSSLTASNSGTISFTSIGSYRNYAVVMRSIVAATNTATFQMVTSLDNGSTYQNSGYAAGFNYNTYNTNVLVNVNSASLVPLSGPNASGNGLSGIIYLYGMNSSAYVLGTGNISYRDSTVGFAFGNAGGLWSGGTACNAFQFAFSSGNISSGVFDLYAILES